MPAYLEPQEETFTQWYNPLDVPQYVEITHDGQTRPTRYTFKPGETREMPSRYDYAIHRVYNGAIIGGLAPQLVKVGSTDKLDPALDTTLAAKVQAEADASVAAAAKQAAEEALVLAEHRKLEADKAAKAKGDAKVEKPKG